MPKLKIGIDIAPLRLPATKALHAAAELGADGVELDARGDFTPANLSTTGLRQLRKMLDDLRLPVVSLRFRTRRGYDNPVDLDRRVEATKAALTLAGRLGARSVTNHVGRPPDEQSGSGGLLVEVLTDLADHGNRVGAFLAAETGGDDPADLSRLLESLPEGIIGVDLNVGNLAAAGQSPREAIELFGPRILHVHATDGYCDAASGRGRRAEIGSGSADFPTILAALDEVGYRGFLTVEPLGGAGVLEETGRAVAFLRQF